jgi:hypothetical protein
MANSYINFCPHVPLLSVDFLNRWTFLSRCLCFCAYEVSPSNQ